MFYPGHNMYLLSFSNIFIAFLLILFYRCSDGPKSEGKSLDKCESGYTKVSIIFKTIWARRLSDSSVVSEI